MFMTNKMLIDARHPEETRVVVVHGNRVEEFDFEAENRKQLRGNIYLAKVTRVEPSLQAAFVEYGGNRHGFLAFSEIHPDYYQIPVADREALLREQEENDRSDEDDDDSNGGGRSRRSRSNGRRRNARSRRNDQNDASADTSETSEEDVGDETVSSAETGDGTGDTADENNDVKTQALNSGDDSVSEAAADDEDEGEEDGGDEGTDDEIEQVGAEDAMEEAAPRRQRHSYRQYKIQEVIKRRQILLVQVVKEERGNKGAALTTYLSLAGRYCVLMPNTARGGGISRKITNATDRKRLKEVATSLDVAPGMGLIVRTAGAKRTKAEIKRDYEYLMRLWDSVRALTFKSTAPTLVYEEGNLVKRSIRDLYDKSIDTVLVEGEEGYREAKNFMRMLMPSHAKNVQPYRDTVPLFQRHQIEPQLDSMFNPVVTLKSGGYVVINPTEALVAVDVNSGRSTKERNIEATALKTNLEAAEEVARQLRLRDLAGLIVIDFIDMEENRNNRAVERKLKECLKNDRARIQVGRISPFGLLELSRQRMRSGMLEGSTVPCAHCHGTGWVRSVESLALHVLRSIEAEAVKQDAAALTVKVPDSVALYILNQKRHNLLDIEQRYDVSAFIESSDELDGDGYNIETSNEARILRRPKGDPAAISMASAFDDDDDDVVETADDESTGETEKSNEDSGNRRGRRRRRRREPTQESAKSDSKSDDKPDTEDTQAKSPSPADDEDEDAADDSADASDQTTDQSDNNENGEDGDKPRRRRRRGRRGGRRNRQRQDDRADGDNQNDDNAEQPTVSGPWLPQDDEEPLLLTVIEGETVEDANDGAASPEAVTTDSEMSEIQPSPEVQEAASEAEPTTDLASEAGGEPEPAVEPEAAVPAVLENAMPVEPTPTETAETTETETIETETIETEPAPIDAASPDEAPSLTASPKEAEAPAATALEAPTSDSEPVSTQSETTEPETASAEAPGPEPEPEPEAADGEAEDAEPEHAPEPALAETETVPSPVSETVETEPAAPKRRGWWQRS